MHDQFNTDIDRRGTGSTKWDLMEKLFGVSPEDGLAMWTADSDYPSPACILDAARKAADFGVFGYHSNPAALGGAVAWWTETRHGWTIQPDWVVATQGIGHAIANAIQLWTDPEDPVVVFSPVYHEFANKIRRLGREVLEVPLARSGDCYNLDLDAAAARMTGREKLLIWCSPQNPTGRIWSADELRALADFAEAHDLVLLSDEIHQDLIYPGETFTPAGVAAPDIAHRLVVATAASKTFNIAGQRTGYYVIPDEGLRKAMLHQLSLTDYKPSMLGEIMTIAAYSPEGAAWVDAQMQHLDGNRKAFDEMVNAIPGVRSIPLQSTYLAWVDFAGTGMPFDEVDTRIRKDARIAANNGPMFGTGGETCVRFNLATSRARVIEAAERLQKAFADLQ